MNYKKKHLYIANEDADLFFTGVLNNDLFKDNISSDNYEEGDYCIDDNWKNSHYKESDFKIIENVDNLNISDLNTSNSENKAKKTNQKSKKEMSIHKDHRKRMREKFLKCGLDGFSEVEIIEFLLFYSIPQRNTNELAHKLLDKFGSLKNVLNTDFFELTEIDGISEVSASLITLFREMHKYINTVQYDNEALTTSSIAGKFCCDYFKDHNEESFIVISLDSNSNIICVDVISKGTENETAYYPRRVIRNIIKNRCNVVILAHNHPGENANPSNNDITVTNKLGLMLSNFGVVVKDHIICAGDNYFSMSDRGLIIS